MNNTYNESFEENFNIATKMSARKYDYHELLALLHSDKIVEKQIAVLELKEVQSSEDAKLLVSNLINQDGKIREVVAFKINELIQNPKFTKFFLEKDIYDIFAKAIMDINGNVCRQVIEAIDAIKFNKFFCEYFAKKLAEMLNDIFKEIEEIDLTAKQYVISKRNFHLYWCLEALYDFVEHVELSQIKETVLKCGTFYDYTIREKIAKILTKGFWIIDVELNGLKEILKNDENYYVRMNCEL